MQEINERKIIDKFFDKFFDSKEIERGEITFDDDERKLIYIFLDITSQKSLDFPTYISDKKEIKRRRTKEYKEKTLTSAEKQFSSSWFNLQKNSFIEIIIYFVNKNREKENFDFFKEVISVIRKLKKVEDDQIY